MSPEDIRKDLIDIRYYYSRKEQFDKAERLVGPCEIRHKVDVYNKAVCKVSPKLYDFYVSMFVFGNTQEGLAAEYCCSTKNISMLSKSLVETLQKILNKGE